MLEEIFGEKNDLVEKALTHPSFTKENDINSLENYERLEFFGDSVLKLFTSKLLYIRKLRKENYRKFVQFWFLMLFWLKLQYK